MINKAWTTAILASCGALAALAIALYLHRDIPAEVLEAEYARPPSRFMQVDGVRMHYRDQGHGPTIILIHDQFDSLLMWEKWTATLQSHYRVIRFDLTSHGLTGPDATGDYSLERTVALLEGLADRLRLGKFSIAGSSMGGTTALYYAAHHPERVDRLILVSPEGIGERVIPERAALIDVSPVFDVLAYTAPRFFSAGLLRNGFGDPSRVSDALIQQRCEMLRRAGNRPGELARIRQFDPVDMNGNLRAIRAPVLVMWGEKSAQALAVHEDKLRRAFRHAHSVRIEIVRGAGSMAVQEDPEGTARRAKEFLDAGHGNAPQESAPQFRDPRFDHDGYELPTDSVYLTRAA
jgi:pimeloyl-ACP methyl ester carboxylesterase